MTLSYTNLRLRRAYHSLPIFIRDWVATLYSLTQRRKRFGGVFASQLTELLNNAGHSPEELASDQLTRLRNTLVHAGANVPYYRRMFREVGFDPNCLNSLSDLQLLPLLDKQTLHENLHSLRAEGWKSPSFVHHSGGTTGTALHFTLSEAANQRHYAVVWFHHSWAGVKLGEPIASFVGHPLRPPDSWRPPFWVQDRAHNEMFFSPVHITDQTLPLYAEALVKHRPVLIRGYPSLIYLVALHLLETGRRDIRPRGIFTFSETLLERQRQAIKAAFGCRVYSSYGNGERTGHILQCDHGNFHVVTETGVVEVLRTDGKPAAVGEVGELVITSLINGAMPLIRYRIGDTGVWGEGKCTCGRASPILSDLTGRLEDFIITLEGQRLGPLNNIFADTLSIRECQFVQEKDGKVRVKIVPRPAFAEADEDLLLGILQTRFGSRTKFYLQVVDEIPRTAGAKLRLVVREDSQNGGM